MQTEASTRTLDRRNLAVALFTETRSVRDAVADLRQAGFGAGQIYVAFSAEHDQFDPDHAELWQSSQQGIFKGEHSVLWRLRHTFERDLHHRTGAGKAGEQQGTGTREHLCTEVNLHDALKAIGVAEDRIRLVNQQVGAHGALIIVDAVMEARKAEMILEKNCGQTRTGTATERPPGAWRIA